MGFAKVSNVFFFSSFLAEIFAFGWDHFANDLLAVVKEIYPNTTKKIVGIGHSSGAVAQ